LDELAALEALLFWAAKKRAPVQGALFFWWPEEDLNRAGNNSNLFCCHRYFYFSGIAPIFAES